MTDRTAGGLPGLVADLAVSVEAFHERFGVGGASTGERLLNRIPIQEEEVREPHRALLHESLERVADEATDVLFVAIGTLECLDPELVARAVAAVIEKNDAKTPETHHVNAAGKVVRRR